jgi:hypothetical protein
VEPAEWVGSVELVVGIAHPRCPQVVADAATGNTIQHTAVERLIETERPRIDLEVAPAATLLRTAKPAPDNRSDVRAAICPATEAAEGPVAAIGQAAKAPATEPAGAEEIVSEDGISRAAGAETGTLSEEVPKATADRALVLTAVAALPAWDPGAEVEAGAVEEAVAVGGAGRRPGREPNYTENTE